MRVFTRGALPLTHLPTSSKTHQVPHRIRPDRYPMNEVRKHTADPRILAGSSVEEARQMRLYRSTAHMYLAVDHTRSPLGRNPLVTKCAPSSVIILARSQPKHIAGHPALELRKASSTKLVQLSWDLTGNSTIFSPVDFNTASYRPRLSCEVLRRW